MLDAACGVGYGTRAARRAARRRWSASTSSEEAIAYARARYAAPNVEFRVGDLLGLDLDDGVFDVVCSFETIEHLPDREAFLDRASRACSAPDGVYSSRRRARAETTEAPGQPVPLRRALARRLRARSCVAASTGRALRPAAAPDAPPPRLQRLDVLGLRRRLGFLRRASDGSDRHGSDGGRLERRASRSTARDLDAADVLVAVCRRPSRA